MANERLRGQMLAAGVTVDGLAAHAQVDPKTVERWISRERIPHRRHRFTVAKLLGCDDTYLWPVTPTQIPVVLPAENDRSPRATRPRTRGAA